MNIVEINVATEQHDDVMENSTEALVQEMAKVNSWNL